ncbi:hypothetical protein [Streptomyces antibioticus]|uniref:hypothetical protein n=1 Tax=Streptomyces antibioticus TaxID=1890 RepID=UPI0036B93A26
MTSTLSVASGVVLVRELNRQASGPGWRKPRVFTAVATGLLAALLTAYAWRMPHMRIPEPVVDLLPGALLMFALVVLIRELSRGAGRGIRMPWLLSAVAAIILAELL